ncbi:MAG: copper chaperone PCu(A)C [Burkholderiales bacterium]|nr:copper chaperone PCu(A)C [Burkholderiales bacterium]MBH2015157.1 copper chaperone PCu(A)C [Burkholderiales bacterium]
MPMLSRRTHLARAAVLIALCAGSAWVPSVGQTSTPPRPTPAADQNTPWVRVEGGWVRPAVKGQSGTGAFMVLTSRANMLLTGVSSPAAQGGELHLMSMDGNVMNMRPVPSIRLPAGRPVALQPGPDSHHLMLTGLKGPLMDGVQVTLVLRLQLATGEIKTQSVTLPVRNGPVPPKRRGPGGQPAAAGAMGMPAGAMR